MNKVSIVALGLLLLVAILFYGGVKMSFLAKVKMAAIFDPLNATYTIENQPVKLVNGKASTEAAPGSATRIETAMFGSPISGDVNSDGRADAAVIIVQNPGGSGTFYYVAVALNLPTGTQGTNAILLGDRIAPQTLEIQNGKIIANYADRKPGQSFSTQPSVGVSKYITLNGTTLTAIAAKN